MSEADEPAEPPDRPRSPDGDRPRRRRFDPRFWIAILFAIDWPSPRKIRRIARWEVGRTATTLDRRTLLVLVAGAVIAAVVGPGLVSGQVSLEQDIYRVGVSEDSEYYPVVQSTPQFVAHEPSLDALDEGRIDVLVRGTEIRHHASPKGRAAYAAFRSAVQNYNDQLMQIEVDSGGDSSAAFPVEVTLRYDSQAVVQTGGGGGGGGGGGIGGGGGGGTDPDRPLQVPNLGGGSGLTVGAEGSPSDIQPPFPFGSLVLAFLFIIPMNFVIQSYGSTIMDERLNRRGELLLVTPVTRTDIIVGKTLPYFAALAGVTTVITLGLSLLVAGGSGAGLLSIAAVLPLASLFLASSFVGAMFARSYKELTFVTLAISVFLTSYAFVPAIFTEITPIALISPLTLVVRDLQGVGATPLGFAFSTGPLLFSSLVLFALGAGVYREEDMFTQRSVPLKALDAMAAWIRGKPSVGAITAAFVPFVFVAELLAIALLFALPIVVSTLTLLLTIAVIEEIAKSAHVYAGYEHGRYDRGWKSVVGVGVASGIGFFFGEKLFLIVQVVGLQELFLGQAAFPQAQQSLPVGLALVLLFAPLALHTVTATISSFGASRSKYAYVASLCLATIVHLAYNLGVIVVAR